MKKSEIAIGHHYFAKVHGKLVIVRVDAIQDTGLSGKIAYDVTNLSTGRRTTFRSAAKFRGVAPDPLAALTEELTRGASPSRRADHPA